MFATHRKIMQLLLFYCIVIQSCVLRDVESTLTQTQSSAESEMSGETVRHTDGNSGTTMSSFQKAVWANKWRKLAKMLNTETSDVLNRETRDTANKEYVDIRDTDVDRKKNDTMLDIICFHCDLVCIIR